MSPRNLECDPLLANVLHAFYEYWLTIDRPAEDREVCYSWVAPVHARRFGGTFHQSALQRLADLGLLIPADSARSGNRRYYKIADLVAVQDLIRNSAAAVT